MNLTVNHPLRRTDSKQLTIFFSEDPIKETILAKVRAQTDKVRTFPTFQIELKNSYS